MKIMLAAPRGFCAGVRMATESLKRALDLYGAPVLVYHEIVHNNWIVDQFENAGVVFINDINEAPRGSVVMFSAHGVAPEIRQRAAELELTTIDATCPLVRKVHDEATRFSQQGFTVFLIGHAGHDEVVGTLGISDRIHLVESIDDVDQLTAEDPSKTAYVMQTTLSVDDSQRIVDRLRERFPSVVAPPKQDICYATQNRQEAVRELGHEADVVLVVGSTTSSNSTRLKELGASLGRPAYLVDGPDDIDLNWFTGDETVLITAGASAPEILTQRCVDRLVKAFGASVEERLLRVEHAQFPLPIELREAAAAKGYSLDATNTSSNLLV